ncbi:MAG: hypothetical protein KGJ57_17085 [Sphingomonadales bacterium]|nr:hypothetical protein [Sphingomonadales bacterium]
MRAAADKLPSSTVATSISIASRRSIPNPFIVIYSNIEQINLAFSRLSRITESGIKEANRPAVTFEGVGITMARLAIPTRDDAPAEAQAELDAVHARLGVVPALYRLLSTAPDILAGFQSFSSHLDRVVDVKLRERLALALAQHSACDYSLAAHNWLAINTARISPDEIARNRQGVSSDPVYAAALRFAVAVAQTKGHVDDGVIAAARDAGFSDADLVALVALTAQNLFTNMLNSLARTEPDFPRCAALAPPEPAS